MMRNHELVGRIENVISLLEGTIESHSSLTNISQFWCIMLNRLRTDVEANRLLLKNVEDGSLNPMIIKSLSSLSDEDAFAGLDNLVIAEKMDMASTPEEKAMCLKKLKNKSKEFGGLDMAVKKSMVSKKGSSF